MTAYPALGHLFGAYLNQDVFDFYPDEFAGSADFAAQEPGLAATAVTEIELILSTSSDDDEIIAVLDQLGLEIRPVCVSYREWLTQIAARVRAATT